MSKPIEKAKKYREVLSYIVAIADADELIDKMRQKGYEDVEWNYDSTGFNKEIVFEKWFKYKL